MTIRLSMGHVDTYDDTVGAFARQLGLTGVQLHNPSNLPDEHGHWRTEDLVALKERCAGDGLAVDGLENVPVAWFDHIQRGGPRRDEQLDAYRRTIRNMGAAGIDMLGYNFLVTYVWRTDMYAAGRGGALVSAFDLAEAGRGNALSSYKLTPKDDDGAPAITAEQLWDNHQYFLDAVLPVAEEAGVRLALHPDDPPVDEPLGGAARIFTSPEAIERVWRSTDGSRAWGLNLCLGTVSEMAGSESVFRVIDTLAPAGAIAYVHFRDVVGTVPSFREGFLGEGNFDPAAVVRALRDHGFDGFMIDDHVPAMTGDVATWGDTSSAAYCSRARAHAIGYLQGVLNAIA